MSTVSQVEPRGLVAGVGWRTLLPLILAGLGAIVFWLVAALPYFMFDQAHLGLYSTRKVSIFVHISAGTIALLTGPVQLWLGLSDRRIDIHRRLGQVYMIAVLISSVAAYYLSTHTEGP